MSLISWHSHIGIPNFSRRVRHRHLQSHELSAPLDVSKGCEALCPEEVRTMAFSRVSTGDSVIPSSCEMKYEPAFKPLQGNPAFFESGHLGVHST